MSLDADDAIIVRQVLLQHDIHPTHDIVTIQPKVIIGNQVVFSQYSKRVKKRNSYTVAFVHPRDPNQVQYGRVQTFLTCPADADDCIHIAIIAPLITSDFPQLIYPPEIRCLAPLLCCDFIAISGEQSANKVAIPVECILYKCFDISGGFPGLTALVNESEVAI